MRDNKYIYINEYQKIDIVYTYVNNTDPRWKKKYFKYTNDINKRRFNFNGEILYSLLTVQKFFNWVNKIYIVNDNQKFNLDFLDDIIFKKKIVFIDHKDIIPKKYLPTFNSRVIECFLWKIKDLKDYFLYLNDDVFFGNYIYYSDFFTENNIFKNFAFIKDEKNKPYIRSPDKPLKNLSEVFISRENTIKIFNDKFKTYYYVLLRHTTHNFNKNACKYAYFMFIKYLEKTFELKTRKYNNNNNNITTKKDFCFLTLTYLVQFHFKLSIHSKITKYENFNNLTNDIYNEIVNLKPKIFNLNSINSENINVWNKLQKNYFKMFNNNKYDNLIKKIENDIKDIEDV
jgi:hypothetical protein